MDWNVEPTMHKHTFAASDDPGPYKKMKLAELRAGAPNECKSPDLSEEDPNDPTLVEIPDKSSYWTPALTSDNVTPAPEWVDPEVVLVYYRNAGVDPNTIRPFPQNLSIVAGDKNATLSDPQDELVMDWSCVANKIPGAGDNEVHFGSIIPDSCPKELVDPTDSEKKSPFVLRLVVYFPNCINLDDPQNLNGQTQFLAEDVSYAEDIGGPPGEWVKECKTQDHEPIPQVQMGFRWPLNLAMGATTDPTDPDRWDLTSLKISSDMQTGQDRGVSAHMGFMSGWSEDDIEKLMETCFWDSAHGGTIGPRKCGSIADNAPYYEQN